MKTVKFKHFKLHLEKLENSFKIWTKHFLFMKDWMTNQTNLNNFLARSRKFKEWELTKTQEKLKSNLKILKFSQQNIIWLIQKFYFQSHLLFKIMLKGLVMLSHSWKLRSKLLLDQILKSLCQMNCMAKIW